MANKINIDKFRQVLKDPDVGASIQIVKLLESSEVAMDGTSYQIEVEIVPSRDPALVTITQNENHHSNFL